MLLEKCSLRMAAVLSFEKAAIEVGVQTGIKIGHSALHRLVSQKEWSEPIAELSIKETSVDGGKVRVRGQQGEGSQWLDYKAVRLHSSFYAAYFQENESLINFVNNQPLSPLLTCLGDGHDRIWNLINKFNPQGRRREILDWFHLMENLHKVGGSNKRLEPARKLLWEGQVKETIKLFESAGSRQAANFCNYITKHRHRIVNYQLLSEENICSIGSGAVESTVKQIDRRLKISGAQWSLKNISQMLKLRCTYLNELL
ncbi:ISKra4 family transposase [Microcoleus sp. w2-18aC4]|uniref:ISKra4 family transposase n=1 Tax=Microcoleus sp. w2-18aC4 TaxID=2818996 RepID=UPI004040C8E2